MLRAFHRWPGLLAALLLLVLSLSGAALSVFPAVDRMGTVAAAPGQTVADLAAKVAESHPAIEQIRRAPSGRITAYWFDGDTPRAAVIDPATGQDAGSADPSALREWLTDLHRALLAGDAGRWTTAVAALAMLVLALSGAVLVARRQGGWRRILGPMRGPAANRWHGEMARLAVLALALSSVTALWMTASTFDLLPADDANPAFPAEVSGRTGLSPAGMPALQAIPLSDLRDLTFPYAGDAGDVLTLTTASGTGYVDQGTGALLVWATPGVWTRAGEWIYLLHTGEGAALWGLLLGLLTLSVPVLCGTGTLVWLRARKARPALRGMAPADRAETVILAASEGGSTWGFAQALGRALQDAGQGVHLAPLSGFAPGSYGAARRILILAATWGDGDAPSTATGAVERIAGTRPHPTASLAVLGFGDRNFPAFCAFAEWLDAAARQAGWRMLLPLDRIDRQSPQAFARWTRTLGQTMGIPLDVTHQPALPRSLPLTLATRRDHGGAAQAPTAILRFALPRRGLLDRLTGRGLPDFRPGDLLGILPEGSPVPRYYSLASGHADGFAEIVVRKHPGGLCSGQLTDLAPGGTVRAFLRPNPAFHPDRSMAPLLLIGAGTGIGPLAGFIRANRHRRPIHLWFGARHPQADFLYQADLADWTAQGQLASTATAFSRTGNRQHVQDRLRADAGRIRALVAEGARIMVCGGRDMAQGVHEALADILAPMNLSPDGLKQQGRYAEDSY
ncbi:PepSY domain-containing protein [Rhodobacteraceae bacterium HSP-20]|uniref:NADPH--hemoprotein reductase n=1 Tax=Paragemmobacter amnigenus TaxID=2852097 RepID=A0ABS6J4J9_9RHOB|nr:PepSY domain-containing protein [Rhodobacter amnigenus]MBU9698674.1 PepSY domain-containing protein [Rhodobacter amnigenus]MBV4389901.1 PepSY domain-containing protein [Rhodobacter amnigenus]